MAATKTSTAKKTVAAHASWVADKSMLFNDPDSPFAAAVAKGAPKLVVVTGENASGKSLFVRIIADLARREKAVPVSISIRERTGSGTFEMAGMRRAMMFGEEHEQSTGATSVGVTKSAFSNLNHEQGSILVLDEPEIGLAESYTRALGEFIGSSAKTIPAVCRGIVVVTHSRPLVQGLLAGYGKTPTHAVTAAEGTPTADIEQWLSTPEHRTVEELLNLKSVGLERWRAVNKLLKD